MTPTIRHSQFVVDYYRFSVADEYQQYNIEGDRSQGLGVPAKALTVKNHGGGEADDHLIIQHSPDNRSWTNKFQIYEGEIFIVRPEHGIWISQIRVSAKSIGLVCSIHAAPGVWSDTELEEISSNLEVADLSNLTELPITPASQVVF
jgi:hypothetical protein